jgi:hypothetical protein
MEGGAKAGRWASGCREAYLIGIVRDRSMPRSTAHVRVVPSLAGGNSGVSGPTATGRRHAKKLIWTYLKGQ